MSEQTEGLRIAHARIAEEAKRQTGFLDLGRLGLTALPEALFGLQALRCLNLGDAIQDEQGKWRNAASDIASNQLQADLSRLAELPALVALSICGMPVRDLSPLSGLSALQMLYCWETQVADLSPLSGLAALQSLICANTKVIDLSPLSGLSALQTLDCGSTRVADLSPLSGLSALQELDCGYTEVADLSPLSGLTALQDLNCGNTQVADLSPLSGLTVLQELHCWNTSVADLSPLSGLSALQELRCWNTPVADLSPLAELPRLRKLDLSGCKLSQIPKGFWDKPSLERLDLYGATLPGIPAEVLGIDCLHRLRAHLQDLQAGAAAVTDLKLMLLGNGRVGKTQIARRLKGEAYDDSLPSTHGIAVSSVPMAVVGAVSNRDPRRQSRLETTPTEPPSEPSRLETAPTDALGEWKLWDFGGQDIYHGTHALFLKTRAVFLLVWATQTEASGEHECGGMVFRNHPLAYWLEYVRHLAGTDSPVIIVQTRCDRVEDEALHPPLDESALAAFPFRKLVHYSALKDRGRAALDEALAEAADWLRERQDLAYIGKGRMQVRQRLEALRDQDAQLPPAQRQYRTLTQAFFRQICAEVGGVSSPDYLLDYLHNTGTVFYRPKLFDGAIVLDQGWALEAIYAVFHRGKVYRELRRLHGRFTRTLLDLLVWGEHGEQEQKLFLQMMQSCRVCFVYREGDDRAGIEAEYIAPDLLPDKAEVEPVLAERWRQDGEGEQLVLDYAWLHTGLLRGFIARLGNEAGASAVYWQDGLCFYDHHTGSRAWVEQEIVDGWRGVIRLQTQQGQAAELLQRLLGYLREEQRHWGLCGVERDGGLGRMMAGACPHPNPLPEGEGAALSAQPSMAVGLDIREEPSMKQEICISYAWGDDTPEGKARAEVVERFCAAAQRRGFAIVRDKDELKPGDSLSQFMRRIGASQRILIVLSDQYLKSPNCMYELFEIWRNSKQDKAEFKQRAGVYRLSCAKIFTLGDRARYAAHWVQQHRELEALLREHGPGILGDQGFHEFKRMADFAQHVGDILDFFKDTLHPGKFEDLERHEFGEDEGST